MKNVYIYCEGQTEETFINEILYPYFISLDILVMPIICTTKRTKMTKFKGGVSDYSKIKNELTILCKQHKNEILTTMFDYYGMPINTPGINNNEIDIYFRIEQIESSIDSDIDMPNLFFGLLLHEFEGLLFSEPEAFSLVANDSVVAEIKNDRNNVESPEHINNSPETAPSKRLGRLMPNYPKVKNGLIVSKETGIDKIMAECKHFARWIEKIRNA